MALPAITQPKLWGTLPYAGKPGAGLVYELNLNGEQYSSIHAFTKYEGEKSRNQVLLADNDKFYGIAVGGFDQFGTLMYEYDPATQQYNIISDFYDPLTGIAYTAAEGYLMQASDGLIYGFTQNGGANMEGQLFSYDPAEDIFEYLAEFEALITGSNPVGALTEAGDGLLYGVTTEGGVCNYGTLFSYDHTSGSLLQVRCFNWSDGADPADGPVTGSNGMLYGMTNAGGANGDGIIYSYETGTGIYTILHDFNTAAHGGKPYGRLFQASDGELYGMASAGGLNSSGILFKYDISLDLFILRVNFDGTNGQAPNCSLIEFNGLLYGMTNEGGVANEGVLFSYDPVANSIVKLADFYGEDYGRYPYGSLTTGPDNMLYGQTYSGGKFGNGVMFKYNTNNLTFAKCFDFEEAPEGAYAISSLYLGDDGWAYGTTYGGGQYQGGTIYRVNPDDRQFESLYEFDIYTYGGNPTSGLIQAADGYFYGVTPYGGTVGAGIIYRFDTGSKMVTVLEDLITPSEGSRPAGPPVEASDGMLFGLTTQGGAMGDGALYKFNLSNSTYLKQVDFQDAASGSHPQGSLVKAANGKLYALAESGGQFGYGTLFEYDPTGGTFFAVAHFDGLNKGATPVGTLVEYDENILYGVCMKGGIHNAGTIFEFDAEASTCTKVFDFNPAEDGYEPRSSLMKASNNKLYGTTNMGGDYGSGVMFEMDPESGEYNIVHQFKNYREHPWFGALLEVDTDFGFSDGSENDIPLEVFPNPASNIITVNTNKEILSLVVTDLLGNSIITHNGTVDGSASVSLNIESLEIGIYLILVTTAEGTAVRKFLVGR